LVGINECKLDGSLDLEIQPMAPPMGLYNFVGTAIDNIGGTLHFDGTEDGVENGSLDWEEDKPLRITA
jgi:hypothetical protein